ncbi:hypothetical protein [Arenibaculum sp.]|uniref:hypothetical protein n=1 Tax=Arenibaculum sp. TaxID=2865862 RepID=UPI002E0D4AAB|nr:hypothetical protein [Arenibaculum sp.]
MTPRGARTLSAALNLCTDLARDVAELNANLKANRPAIDELGAERPDLWDNLARHTKAKRAALAQAGKH